MSGHFDVGHLSAERLLADWRWLCDLPVRLIARNAFGDLFLCDEAGGVLKLDVSIGKLSKIATSIEEFFALATTEIMQNEWFGANDEKAFAGKGLVPGEEQCIAFKVPTMFHESAGVPDNVYLGDIYEYVSFLGAIHKQIASLPDGSKISFRFSDDE